jgi:hypothetical protein
MSSKEAGMANSGRGGGGPHTGKGASAGERGGNRGGEAKPRPDPNGPGNDRQAQGKDPHRGQPG